MKTDDLITMLATGPDVDLPLRPNIEGVALVVAAILISTVLMVATLGVRADLIQAVALPAFWIKVTFVLALALFGWRATERLSLPGVRVRSLPFLIAAPLVMMWTLGLVTIINAEPDARAQLFWGQTWKYCPALIAMLSLPIFGAIMLVLRRTAPTRLTLAGAAAGFAAGSSAALVYTLHCPETASSFIGFWYVLGILVPTVFGALIGRRALAW
ncbi:DUF1109 domain-containing protein [Actimicrobium antarcticum]|uniref:NrsF family protein n=1 Tax=Actimicrobium antarcticum TaxID=1051899 RepID=A0ABP7TSE0_9BURK